MPSAEQDLVNRLIEELNLAPTRDPDPGWELEWVELPSLNITVEREGTFLLLSGLRVMLDKLYKV